MFQSGRIVNIPLEASRPRHSDTPPTTTEAAPVTIDTNTEPITDVLTDADLTDKAPEVQQHTKSPKMKTIRMSRSHPAFLKMIIPVTIGSTVTVLVVIIICIKGK